jgi:hypothetical protein
MGINYKNLDSTTRKYMLHEFENDLKNNKLELSNRLTEAGRRDYLYFLKEAIQHYDDNWLAEQIREKNFLYQSEIRKKADDGVTLAKIPATAAETLADGDFNHYYVRGLCARAIAEGIDQVIVYRGKEVENPRPESRELTGQILDPRELLEGMRARNSSGKGLMIPAGPNSGLTISIQ